MENLQLQSIPDIDAIIERFDFKRVLDHMIAVDWKWRGETPTLEELKSTARFALVQVIMDTAPSSNCGTGGFRAYKFPWGVELVFSIERCGSF